MNYLKKFNESRSISEEISDINQMFLNISDEYDFIKLDDVNQNLYTVKDTRIWSLNRTRMPSIPGNNRIILEIGINKVLFNRLKEFEIDLESFIDHLNNLGYKSTKSWNSYSKSRSAGDLFGIYTISILI